MPQANDFVIAAGGQNLFFFFFLYKIVLFLKISLKFFKTHKSFYDLLFLIVIGNIIQKFKFTYLVKKLTMSH